MKPRKLLRQILESPANVHFADFSRLVEAFGFRRERTSGSHNIYRRDGVRELINIQDVRGQAKPYQIRQFLKLVERYNLTLEGSE